jgi:hypothetical protein
MNARALLDYLADTGYSIRTDGRMLYVRGRAPLDQEIKDGIAGHKAELITELLALQTAAEQVAEEAVRVLRAVRARGERRS